MRVEGTLFGNRAPRLVKIFGIPVEAELTGQMIYIVNTDAPGFIGALGTALGEARINIATFNLGREKPGGDAITVVALDERIDDATLKEVTELPHVVRAKRLEF